MVPVPNRAAKTAGLRTDLIFIKILGVSVGWGEVRGWVAAPDTIPPNHPYPLYICIYIYTALSHIYRQSQANICPALHGAVSEPSGDNI